ncbi:MAG: lysostaphin resistance A-like protein [Planctomycetota bacterium]
MTGDPAQGPPRAAGADQVLTRAVVAFLVAVVPVALAPSTGLDPMLVAAASGVAVLVLGVVWPPVPWRPLHAGGVVARYLLFALLWVPLMVGYLWVMRTAGHPVAPQPMLEQLARDGMSTATLPAVLGIVVLAPLTEELVFRGYLLGVLLLALPPVPAHLLTAAAFGAVHGLPYALPLALVGLCFGWLRHRYGSLLPSMLAHALHNGLVLGTVMVWPGALDLLYPR